MFCSKRFDASPGSARSRKGTVVFLHGAPTQSYSYRVVLEQVYSLLCMHISNSWCLSLVLLTLGAASYLSALSSITFVG